MKQPITILLIGLISTVSVFSQNCDSIYVNNEKIEKPQFESNGRDIIDFINNEFMCMSPNDVDGHNKVITVIIDKEGIAHPKSFYGFQSDCEEKIKITIRSMPAWTPAHYRENKVCYELQIPVVLYKH